MSEQQKKSMTEKLAVFGSYEAFIEEHGSKPKAQQIRILRAMQEEEDRGAIAKFLGIRYQWVRNVLIQPVKEK